MSDLTLSLLIACVSLHLVILLLSSRNVLSEVCSSLDFLVVVHSASVLFPIAFDVFYGRPYYQLFPQLNTAINDETTYNVYLAYMTTAGLAFYWSARRTSWFSGEYQLRGALSRIRFILLGGLFLVPFYVPFCPNLPSLFSYGYLQQTIATQSLELQQYYSVAYRLTYISLTCAAALCLDPERPKWMAFVVFPLTLLIVIVNGKRNIVLLAILFFLVAYRFNGTLTGRKLVLTGALLLAAYGAYHLVYAQAIRTFLGSTEARLQASRLDFGHDLDVSLALFLELYPDQSKLLEYRGQTFLFTLCQYVPRTWWETKPYPYYHYLTAKALGRLPGTTRWGLTSSWLGECIANLGFPGALFAPLSLILLCRLGDSRPGMFARLMTVVVSTNFLALDPSSFTPLLITWSILMFTRVI